ncbi:MAG: CHAT domain-containing protein [Gammaproteobacteria bacterium]|nr:CHAT domain-containing protein [Gammaproteobacteria bacterium]
MTINVHEVEWLIADGEPAVETRRTFVNHFGSRLIGVVKQNIETSLASPKGPNRFMTAVRMQMHLAHGVDTETACVLGDALLQLLDVCWKSIGPSLQPRPVAVLASVLSSWIYASIQEGHWNELLLHWRSWAIRVPDLRDEHTYWNAGCYVAIALLRRNELKTVKAFLDEYPEHLASLTPQLTVLRNQYDTFSKGRFELDTKPSIGDQARSIWEHGLNLNVETLKQLDDQTKSQSAATLGWDTAKLPGLIAEVQSQREFAMSDVPFEEKYQNLSIRGLHWRRNLRDFLSPGYDPQHVNAEWVDDCLSLISLIQADAIKSDEFEKTTVKSLADLGRSLRWAHRAGDQHSMWMLRWCAATVYEKRNDSARRQRALHRLSRSLHAKRLATDDPNICSLVAHYFSGLAEKVATLPGGLANTELMMDAFELHRGRALITARADLEANRLRVWGQPKLLGVATHYLGFTVFHEREEVFAQVVSADGRVTIQSIAINWGDLQAAVDNLDPSRRNRRSLFLEPRPPLWLTLSRLLKPLEEALTTGRICVGDHVCIAAEDPVHLLPLHALSCANQPMFRLFSSSRVASFSDAERLATENFFRPKYVTALLVDAQHKNPSLRHSQFRQTVEMLRALGLKVDAASPECMDADEVLAHLSDGRVIHLHAHGHFPPGKNPHTHCGIVVSDGFGPPILDGNVSRLLTPAAILAANPVLSGSHLTLNTCVSGKGLPGKYGDALGLEMALRWSGASSLLAAHWNVDSNDATIFCEHFYRAWIRDGQSRARAWQLAIQELADPESSIDIQARWCAFSLYGGWT